MSPDLQPFAQELTEMYIRSGLPRSIAEIVVHLTICEPAEQTALNLQKQLRLSAGSVSTALNMLVTAGLVSRTKLPGSKRYTYELKSEAWEQSILQRIATIERLAQLAEQGVKLAPSNPRLSAMHDMYQYFGVEFKDIMSRFQAHSRSARP
jgi:DNA-binding transcriptional regulator GbsR (MarR family)